MVNTTAENLVDIILNVMWADELVVGLSVYLMQVVTTYMID